jgi:hypothetical protein
MRSFSTVAKFIYLGMTVIYQSSHQEIKNRLKLEAFLQQTTAPNIYNEKLAVTQLLKENSCLLLLASVEFFIFTYPISKIGKGLLNTLQHTEFF